MESSSLTAATDVEVSVGAMVEASKNATSVMDMTGKSVVGGAGASLTPFIEATGSYQHSMSVGDGSITSDSLSLAVGAGVSPIDVHGGISENKLVTRINFKEGEFEYHGKIPGIKKFSIEIDLKKNKKFIIKEE